MPEPSTPDPAIGRILERVRESLPATIERSVATTFADVPAYPASPSPTLRADLTAHTESVFEAVLSSVARGRTASRDDFPITAEHATRRVRAGIELSDFLQGFRIGQVSLWEAIVEAADPERATRDAGGRPRDPAHACHRGRQHHGGRGLHGGPAGRPDRG